MSSDAAQFGVVPDPVAEIGSDETTALAPGGQLVDLGAGRVTRLARLFRYREVLYDGSRGPWTEFHSTVEASVVRAEEHGGRAYVLDLAVERDDAGSPYTTETPILYRQNRSGLYFYQEHSPRPAPAGLELSEDGAPALAGDLSAAWRSLSAPSRAARAAFVRGLGKVALARALSRGADGGAFLGAPGGSSTPGGPPGGVFENEYTMLRYPLHPGATWVGVPGLNVWSVEAVGNTVFPAGRYWTARMNLDLPGTLTPGERVTIWFGVPGEVKHSFRFVSQGVDDQGNPITLFEFEDEQALTGYTPGEGSPM